MSEIIIKTTCELTTINRKQLVDGFNTCFPKHFMSEDELLLKYKSNHYGFSFHVLCEDDGELIGSLSASPFIYDYNGERITIALTCDIFILPEHRNDIRLFSSLYKSLRVYCANKGVICFLGVANDNAYTYTIRLLRCKELFTLPYWILPLRIGNISKKKWLRPLNVVSLLCSYLSIGLNSIVSSFYNSKEKQSICRIVADSEFVANRLPESKYTNYNKGNIFFSYVITNDEDIRCAYIMMVSENGRRSYKALCRCVSYIIRHENVDMVMFNGTLNLKQGLLIRTPKKYEPRQLHLTVNYLTKEFEKQYPDIMKANGIDFTLLNLDVR